VKAALATFGGPPQLEPEEIRGTPPTIFCFYKTKV